MTRDEIQNRLVTVRSLLKRPNLAKRERENAQARQEELEDRLRHLDKLESAGEPVDPDKVRAEIEKIREILKKPS